MKDTINQSTTHEAVVCLKSRIEQEKEKSKKLKTKINNLVERARELTLLLPA